jgi:anti-sigma regulatory factor (Ser/Thr protein kinase)
VRTLLARAGHHPDQQSNQDAQLVVSELVTNALRYAPGPGALLLELSADAARLTIAVRDGSSDQPLLREPDPRRAGGHGLHLVTRLCEQVRTVPSGEGKRIVAELLLDSGAEPGG